MLWGDNRPQVPYRAGISSRLLALRQASPSLLHVPSVLCLSPAEGEWEKGLLAAVSHPLFHIGGDMGFHGDTVCTGRAGAGQSSFQGNCHAAWCCLHWVFEGVCPAETNSRLPHCIPLSPSISPRIPFLSIPLDILVTTAMSLGRCASGTLQNPSKEPDQSWSSQ